MQNFDKLKKLPRLSNCSPVMTCISCPRAEKKLSDVRKRQTAQSTDDPWKTAAFLCKTLLKETHTFIWPMTACLNLQCCFDSQNETRWTHSIVWLHLTSFPFPSAKTELLSYWVRHKLDFKAVAHVLSSLPDVSIKSALGEKLKVHPF